MAHAPAPPNVRRADVTVTPITDEAGMRHAHAIRRRVFIEEQRVPEEIELDADDAVAYHVLARCADEAVGCGRMVAHEGYVKIERMAVLREHRGRGIGRLILEALLDTAHARGFHKAVLHAQLTAEGFYRKSGFKPAGPVFDEAGIAHRRMERAV